MALQRGFDFDIEWLNESYYGSGITLTDTTKTVSDIIHDIRITPNNSAEPVFSVSDVAAADTIYTNEEYTVRIEYELQDTSTAANSLLKYGITRNASNDLDSVAFSVQIGDKYYEFQGGICNTVEVRGEVGRPIIVTQEFFCNDCVDPSTSFPGDTHASAFNSTIAVYGGATITKGGSAIGYGTRSFALTINNNAERVFKEGSPTASQIVAGKLDISGTIDVFIEEDADTQWGWITGKTESNIVIDPGLTNYPATGITLTNAVFDTTDFPLNNSDATLVSGMRFKAEDVSIA